MQEHPIPQDVTGYRFHIVGNMTLKQFAEVAVGVVIAVILYNTNLLFFIKWPLIVLSVGLGGMMAFVPIEERPLDHWITTFFKRLYNPTKFYWKRDAHVPFAMKQQKNEVKVKEAPVEVDLTPARRKRIEDYIKSVQQPAEKESWEKTENNRVSEILDTFDEVKVESVESKPQAVKPQLSPRVRKLPADSDRPVKATQPKTPQPVKPAAETVKTAEPKPDTKPVQPPLKSAPTANAPLQPPVEIFADEEVSVKPA